MPSNLHQLELSYHPGEDRLLLKVHTLDLSEYRFWLTRRFTGAFWGILMKLLEQDEKSQLQHEQEQQKVSKAFEEEQSRKQPLAQKFATSLSKTPLGQEPLLVVKVAATPEGNGIFGLKLEAVKGENIEIKANSYIILSLCKLISETVKKADWNLKLQF